MTTPGIAVKDFSLPGTVAQTGVAAQVTSVEQGPFPLSAGLAELLRAYDYAASLGRNVWDFAVEIGELRALGLSSSDLRWLIVRGLLLHGEETSAYGASQRSFRVAESLSFLGTTAFVLAAEGADSVRESLLHPAPVARPCSDHSPCPNNSPDQHTPSQQAPALQLPDGIKPVWESRRRELRVGDYLVKQFRVPAGNQELVLAAFQEEDWPAVIDDPLPPAFDIVPKRRLRDVITRLNHGQITSLLRFHGNGNGEAVGWRLKPRTAPE